MWSVSPDPAKFQEAVDWFRGKVPLLKSEWGLLREEARRRAFTAAGVASLDLLGLLQASLLRALEQGTPFGEWKKEATRIVQGGLSQAHLETIFRNNVQAAYSAGRWDQLQDPAVRRSHPYLMYDAVLDDRTTDICRMRDGVVRPADDPWWQSNWPPLHHNCRSGVRPLTEAEAQRRGVAQTLPYVPSQEGFGLSPAKEEWVEGYAKGQRQAAALPWIPAFAGPPPDWRSYGRPEALKPQKPSSETLGSLPTHLEDPTGLAVLVDPAVVRALPPGRERYLALLPDLVGNPQEIWLLPLQHERRVAFRQLYVKVYRDVTLTLEVHRGVIVALHLEPKRQGFLRYAP
jgi:SPP1 gp7 family putative phage head morphogenesis protein